jgi:hypothetical protein
LQFHKKAQNSSEPCGDNGWVPYLDTKCFKIFPNELKYRDEAENYCKEERFQSYIPSLVIIKSRSEQEFVANLVFNISGSFDSVWIDAKRNSDNKTFSWNDGSKIEYSNWSEGSPSEDVDSNCVQINSRFAKLLSSDEILETQSVEGAWSNVPCKKRNLVLCQKMQVWSFPQLQYEFLNARKELKDTKDQLSETQSEVKSLKSNPGILRKYEYSVIFKNKYIFILVPIGFIYVQMSGQQLPSILWPEVKWTEISNDYAGLFFRAVGGNASSFGQIQEESSPRLTQLQVVYGQSGQYFNADVTPGIWSNKVRTGGPGNGDNEHHALKVFVLNEEVRPRNSAIRIWIRTG